MNDDFDWDPIGGAGDGALENKPPETHPREETLRQDDAGDSNSPVIPVLNQKLKVSLLFTFLVKVPAVYAAVLTNSRESYSLYIHFIAL
jgi:hypothetical protein